MCHGEEGEVGDAFGRQRTVFKASHTVSDVISSAVSVSAIVEGNRGFPWPESYVKYVTIRVERTVCLAAEGVSRNQPAVPFDVDKVEDGMGVILARERFSP